MITRLYVSHPNYCIDYVHHHFETSNLQTDHLRLRLLPSSFSGVASKNSIPCGSGRFGFCYICWTLTPTKHCQATSLRINWCVWWCGSLYVNIYFVIISVLLSSKMYLTRWEQMFCCLSFLTRGKVNITHKKAWRYTYEKLKYFSPLVPSILIAICCSFCATSILPSKHNKFGHKL